MQLTLQQKLLIMVIAIAFLLRFAPVFLYGVPIGYDTPYHIRMANLLAEEHALPELDPSLGGRTYNYPPFYHIILYSLSQITMLPIEGIAMVFLPLVSLLTVLAIYVFVRRVTNEKYAFVAALLAALANTLLVAAYDSPENVVFFTTVVLVFLLVAHREKFASLLFALNLFWNYFAFLLTIIPAVLAFHKNKKFLKFFVIFLFIAGLFWLYIFGIATIFERSISFGIGFMVANLHSIMPSLIINSGIIVIIILAYSLRKLDTAQIKFWYYYAAISLVALFSYFITPVLRSWEQPKFLALGSVIIIGLVHKTKLFKKFICFLLLLFLCLALLTSFQIAYPKVTSLDYHAIDWLVSANPEGKILAEPTFSEVIMNRTNLDSQLLTALHYEAPPSDAANISGDALVYLADINSIDEQQFLQESGMEYLLLNFEDDVIRGTKHLDSRNYLNKVYDLQYYEPCPFAILPVMHGFACGVLETKIFRVN